MEVAVLRAALDEVRRTEAKLEGAVFTLKVPTDHAWRVALQSNMNEDGRVVEAAAFRAILDRGLVGWTGVTTRHFDMAGADPVEFSAEARAALLDERPDLAQDMILAMMRVRTARRKRAEDAEKN